MKLLLLSEFFPQFETGEITGGVEARNFYFAKYAKKFDLTIFTRRIKDVPDRQTIFNAKIQRIGPLYSYTQQGNLFKRLFFLIACVINAKEKYDLVEGTNFITHLAALIAGRIKKIPVVFWYPDVWQGQWIKILGLKGIMGEILEKIVLFLGKKAKFIAISDSTKNKLITRGINKNNIMVVPCGVDKEEIDTIIHSPREKKYDFVCVNRLVKYKKTDLILQAAIDLNRRLLIIGSGEERRKLTKMVNDDSCQNIISFIKNVESHRDLLILINQAKVFISASQIEGFNIAAVEAIALGLPCLLSDIPAHKELRRNFRICRLFRNKVELKKLMSQSFLVNKKNFSEIYYWNKIVDKTEEFYRTFLK